MRTFSQLFLRVIIQHWPTLPIPFLLNPLLGFTSNIHKLYFSLQNVLFFADITPLGCYKDMVPRAIPTVEGTSIILDGGYWTRENPMAKCAMVARRRGFHMFALQDGGWCATSDTAEKTFDKYGKSSGCLSDGEGGSLANNVYVIKGSYRSVLLAFFGRKLHRI